MLPRVLLLGLLAASLTHAVATGAATASDRRTYTFALPPTRGVHVDLTVGQLRIQGEERSDALIEVVRTAPTQDALSRIPVLVTDTDHDLRIDGRQADGGTDAALRTDITMRVPRLARMDSLNVMEGHITLSALAGTIKADLRRGPIEATSIEGIVRLETGIGDVIVRDARLTPAGLLRLRTFNGDVRLTLAERPAHARVMALALNGHIRSQIPLTMKDTWGPRWGEATIGSGEPVISLDVVTGTIEINTR